MSLKSNLVFLFLVFVAGCISLPDNVAECYGDKICEDNVIQVEDRRFKRDVAEQQEKQNAKDCWIFHKGVWDKRSGWCKSRWDFL